LEGGGEPAVSTAYLTNEFFTVVPWIAIDGSIARAESVAGFPSFLIFHLFRWIQLFVRCVRAMDVRLAFAPPSDRRSDFTGSRQQNGKKNH
jgi:hypothetical protein